MPRVKLAASRSRIAEKSTKPRALTPVQVEIIDMFVQLTEVLGLPKSIGEIYGFVFTATSPATFEDVVEALGISSGSASQGLRMLRGLGAIRPTYVAGDRRDHYVPEIALRKLAAGFVRENFERHLLNGEERLQRLDDLLASRGSRRPAGVPEHLRVRVKTLRNWHTQAKTVLPAVLNFLKS